MLAEKQLKLELCRIDSWALQSSSQSKQRINRTHHFSCAWSLIGARSWRKEKETNHGRFRDHGISNFCSTLQKLLLFILLESRPTTNTSRTVCKSFLSTDNRACPIVLRPFWVRLSVKSFREIFFWFIETKVIPVFGFWWISGHCIVWSEMPASRTSGYYAEKISPQIN